MQVLKESCVIKPCLKFPEATHVKLALWLSLQIKVMKSCFECTV